VATIGFVRANSHRFATPPTFDLDGGGSVRVIAGELRHERHRQDVYPDLPPCPVLGTSIGLFFSEHGFLSPHGDPDLCKL
jgi:hypothetical protein